MNSYKILVVEDEKNICNFMKMIFETNDYQVIFAQNGKNGLTMFFSHNPGSCHSGSGIARYGWS